MRVQHIGLTSTSGGSRAGGLLPAQNPEPSGTVWGSLITLAPRTGSRPRAGEEPPDAIRNYSRSSVPGRQGRTGRHNDHALQDRATGKAAAAGVYAQWATPNRRGVMGKANLACLRETCDRGERDCPHARYPDPGVAGRMGTRNLRRRRRTDHPRLHRRTERGGQHQAAF